MLYLASLAPDLGAIDSGELGAVCARLGVAHPTGYPLYTLLGRCAVLLIPTAPTILRLNLLSAVCAASAAGFACALFRRILLRIRPSADRSRARIVSCGCALAWAASGPAWTQALGNEVHALQLLLVTMILGVAAQPAGPRRVLLLAYLLGLAFANHMTVVYLVPGLAAAAALDSGTRAALRRRGGILLTVGAFALPVLLYLYLPIRSSREPPLDWGDPTSPARLLRHLGGAQYRVWMFASADAFASNLEGFLRGLLQGGWLLVVALSIPGAVFLARADRPAAVRLALGFLVGALWASGYEIHDLEPYFLVARLCLVCLAFAGFAYLVCGLRRRIGMALAAIPIAGAVVLAAAGWQSTARNGDRFIRTYAGDLLDRLPQGTILLSRHWDIVVSPLLYMQQVEGARRDVTIVDPELLRRSWYFQQLRRADPTLLAPIEDRVALFLEDLRLFEEGLPYDASRIEERYRALIAGIFEAHRDRRPVYHTPEVETHFYGGWFGIPEALAIRMVEDPSRAPPAEPLEPDAWRAQARFAGEPVRRNAWSFPLQLGRARLRFLDAAGRDAEAKRWREAVSELERIPPPEER